METGRAREKCRRAVLDTNVLVSGYLFGGIPQAILQAAEERAFVPVTSVLLRNELVRVLGEKFALPASLIQETCGRVWQISEWVSPKMRIALCRDEQDNRILECAVEGRADLVVTGDADLLKMPPIPSLAIVTPREFLEWLRSSR